jgi:hypothetical protein
VDLCCEKPVAMALKEAREIVKNKYSFFHFQINSYSSLLKKKGWKFDFFEEAEQSFQEKIKNNFMKIIKKKSEQDKRGVVASHDGFSVIAVVFHGSRNSNDWNVNFDAKLTPVFDLGLKSFPKNIRVHEGFGKVIKNVWPSLKRNVLSHFNSLSNISRERSRFIFTGHSQGGGLAQLAALYACYDLVPSLFKGHFKNSANNLIYSYVLSSPRVFSKEDIEWINHEFLSNNMLHQYVEGDPVTNLGFESEKDGLYVYFARIMDLIQRLKIKIREGKDKLNQWTTRFVMWSQGHAAYRGFFIEKISFLQQRIDSLEYFFCKNLGSSNCLILNEYKGYGDFGSLAKDHAKDVVKRLYNEEIETFIGRAALEEIDTIFSIDVLGAFDHLFEKGIIKNDELEKIDRFCSLFHRHLVRILAPFHHTSTRNEEVGAYDPKSVSLDLEFLLND